MRIVPAKSGAKWLARGFILFRKNPPVWLLLVLGYWLALALLAQIPLFGPAFSMVLLPAFTMSFMTACAVIESSGDLRPALLFAGFRRCLRRLMILGVLYLVSLALVLAISALADGGALASRMLTGQEFQSDGAQEEVVSSVLLLAAGAPVSLAFWFAPPLIAWAGMDTVQALFYSFFAGLRNWRAFLVYAGALLLAGTVLRVMLSLLGAAMRGQPEALPFVVLLFILFWLPTLFGSFYASYRDVFPEERFVSHHDEGDTTG
jgi:hypothetical protein